MYRSSKTYYANNTHSLILSILPVSSPPHRTSKSFNSRQMFVMLINMYSIYMYNATQMACAAKTCTPVHVYTSLLSYRFFEKPVSAGYWDSGNQTSYDSSAFYKFSCCFLDARTAGSFQELHQ